ncbi:SusD/RagB family nutrient-binding outer membrane lipoprotein [Chitinophaga eiseniae]|uniref:SusD/RagB family nutrient-binding outer membrane lipoprotein n=1 Tax=Chitinophaga eiseniae TaxID=634771 RepID=A0A847SSN3_9BACT|nr:SusD/RagB family nutrient-binding outer membrane lipoprotein [Chitinophaga eiseniae]NLR79252.1 SusD/RagB family nutrient-binding outer membrane lipoprotein [Chitinophaga eiseniae]
MKKRIVMTAIAGCMLIAGAGCKKFLDVNSDPAGASKVDDRLLLTSVQLNDAFNIAGGYPARTAAFWTQQLAYNLGAPDWDSYRVTATDVDITWAFDLYPACLKNLKILETQAAAAGHTHYEGVAKVMIAYNLAIATDLWNEVPYSDGLQGFNNLKPKYDTQESIYQSVFTLLDDGIKLMKGADNSIVQPDAKDLFYGTQADQIGSWVKFAYFLKARYALRLCYAPGKDVKTQAQLALDAAALSFTDATTNPGVKFSSTAGNNAPWFQFLTYLGNTYMSSTFVDLLKAKSDPRLPVIAGVAPATGEYKGRVIGSSPNGKVNGKDTISKVGGFFNRPDQSVYLGTYDELLFIQAEATYLVSGTAAAQPVFTAAVNAAMSRMGLNPSGAEVSAYIAAHCTLTDATAYETIMTEKYVSNFLSLESYNDWRRTNFPKLKVVLNPYQGLTSIPRRFVYPSSENATNKQPQQPGLLTDRVWWDTQR